MLLLLHDGEISARKLPEKLDLKKAVSDIRRRLRETCGLPGDPIPWRDRDKAYKPAFKPVPLRKDVLNRLSAERALDRLDEPDDYEKLYLEEFEERSSWGDPTREITSDSDASAP